MALDFCSRTFSILRGRNLRRQILDILFPRTCVQCGCFLNGSGSVFTCSKCRAAYPIIRDPVCQQCGVPFYGMMAAPRRCSHCESQPPAFVQARSLVLYRDTGARLVHCLKYERGTWLQPEIAALLASEKRWQLFFANSVLIPVPLHFRKEQARGYNQAVIIARAIQMAIPSVKIDTCLRRIRATPTQTFLTREERRHNMQGAFSCRRNPGKGARLIIVDDVLTTGATLDSAIRSLQAAGADEIYAFTLAHG